MKQSQGDNTAAVTHYRQALKLEPDKVNALNKLAWILATRRELALRNAPEAVRLAERACELTGYDNAVSLGTLTAAYASQWSI